MIRPTLSIALRLLLFFTVLTGILYPLCITGIAQVLFPFQAQGSLLIRNGEIIGSQLIGQAFVDPHYFVGRPSATQPFPYNAFGSQASNLGPHNSTLLDNINTRIALLQASDPRSLVAIPVELLMNSGSGLDPHISVIAAFYQVPRVASARKLSENVLASLVKQFIEPPQFGFLGIARVNVLQLNLALDAMSQKE